MIKKNIIIYIYIYKLWNKYRNTIVFFIHNSKSPYINMSVYWCCGQCLSVTCCKLCSCCLRRSSCVWMLCSLAWCWASSCLASLSARSPSSKRSDASCKHTRADASVSRDQVCLALTAALLQSLPYWTPPLPERVFWVSVPWRSASLSLCPAPASLSPDRLSLSAATPPSASALRRAASDPPAPDHYRGNLGLIAPPRLKQPWIQLIYLKSALKRRIVWLRMKRLAVFATDKQNVNCDFTSSQFRLRS